MKLSLKIKLNKLERIPIYNQIYQYDLKSEMENCHNYDEQTSEIEGEHIERQKWSYLQCLR